MDIQFVQYIELFSRLYRQCLMNRLAPYGIMPGQIHTLCILFDEDGLTQKEILKRMHVEQPTLANTLQRMERDGLIEVRRNEKDRRICHYHLTQFGRRARPMVETALDDLTKVCSTGLSVNDVRYFNRIVKQVIGHLEQDKADPAIILADEIDSGGN